MKLTYRGVQYDYTPPAVETKETSDVGIYRGVDIRFRTVAKSPVQQPTLDLMYRGVAYRTGDTAVETPPVVAPVAATAIAVQDVECKARAILMAHHGAVKRRQQAMLVRLAADVGLDADVTHYWNHIQGKVHPSFWATYDRSHAAAS